MRDVESVEPERSRLASGPSAGTMIDTGSRVTDRPSSAGVWAWFELVAIVAVACGGVHAAMRSRTASREAGAADRRVDTLRAQQSSSTLPGSASVAPRFALVRVSLDEARRFLWPSNPPDTHACESDRDPIHCLLALRWSVSADALATVQALWRDLGTVCGVERAHTIDGAYRGMVHIVPEMPVGRYAQHLAWVDRALRDQDAFYRTVEAHAPRSVAYRWTGLGILFYRSTNTRTPAGYAQRWDFAYNVVGGINDSLERIRLTIIHEVFHLNDREHGSWSHTALQPIYDAILRRCGHNVACLRPYAPVLLRVRRTGMFYAFQSGNSDVGEYAAMLAERYYLEQSGQWHDPPFRCGPPENERAWRAIVDEFFGGYDVTHPCT